MITALKNWQQTAIESWLRQKMKGIVVAPTGSGKTLLGVATAQIIRSTPNNCLVVVQTEVLLEQWHKILEFELEETVGRIGAGFDDIRPLTVGIINSLRGKVLPYFKAVIIDQIHHNASEKSISFLADNTFDAILGLTSTLEREDYRHELFKAYGLSVIHNLEYKEAISEKLLSSFDIINVAVSLNEEENKKNAGYSKFIDENLEYYNYDIRTVLRFLPTDRRAQILQGCIQSRKKLLGMAERKIGAVARIMLMESAKESPKAVIFCEFIKSAEYIKLQLDILGFKSGIYHSEITRQERTKVLEDFRNGIVRVLISCKALEEGLDVPNANLGIIVGGSGVKRQIIQRLGRILRHLPGKTAKLYQTYVADSQDEKWMTKRTATVAREASSIKCLDWREENGLSTAR